jgi:hypothetical protein
MKEINTLKTIEPRSRLPNIRLACSLIITAAIAPKTVGIESRNEYLKTFSLSTFLNNPVEIVKPLLEIPGSVAMPWATPTSSESKRSSCFPFFVYFEAYKKIPVIKNPVPTINMLEKTASITSK